MGKNAFRPKECRPASPGYVRPELRGFPDPFKLAPVFTQIKNGGWGAAVIFAAVDMCILSATESLILNYGKT